MMSIFILLENATDCKRKDGGVLLTK